jgi:ATP-dependent helicase HrpB
MMLRARDLGLAGAAADLAALLADRDIMRGDGPADPDVGLRLQALRSLRTGDRPLGAYVDRGAAHRASDESRHWRRRLGVSDSVDATLEDTPAGLLLAFAYPDRIGALRAGSRGRFLLRNGRGASMDPGSAIAGAPFIVAADIEGHGRDSRIHLAAALEREELERHFAAAIEQVDRIAWDERSRSVRAQRSTCLGAIVLADSPLVEPDGERVAEVISDAIVASGFALLPWTRETHQLRARLAFLHHVRPSWPDVSDEALARDATTWLRPFIAGARGADDLRRMDVAAALLTRVPWELRAHLDTLAPSHLEVPSGSRLPIDYGDPDAPALAVRLQEVFGLAETPRIAGDAIPLTLRLLSPAHRPVQVTKDLASFWQHAYFDVRKDLRGRYPRHYWPENPLEAEATRRARPRGG